MWLDFIAQNAYPLSGSQLGNKSCFYSNRYTQCTELLRTVTAMKQVASKWHEASGFLLGENREAGDNYQLMLLPHGGPCQEKQERYLTKSSLDCQHTFCFSMQSSTATFPHRFKTDSLSTLVLLYLIGFCSKHKLFHSVYIYIHLYLFVCLFLYTGLSGRPAASN